MKIVNGKLCFGFHELAWSARTSGIKQYIFDKDGNILVEFESSKKPFCVTLPEGSKYFLRRYWSNKGYPDHKLYMIDGDKLVLVASVTTMGFLIPKDMDVRDLPEKLVNFILEDTSQHNIVKVDWLPIVATDK